MARSEIVILRETALNTGWNRLPSLTYRIPRSTASASHTRRYAAQERIARLHSRAVPGARVTTQEVADAAGVSQPTVRRWAREGVLPPPTVYYGLKPGKHSFWPPHAPAQAR